MKIALLGAEGTGKTTLASQLAAHFNDQGRSAFAAPDALREWCQCERRTPHSQERMAIAQEQERRLDEASTRARIVIADTTALMVAIDGDQLFEDAGLHRFAIERMRGYDLTLLTGLDLPWVADGLQRDGARSRDAVDALLRAALHQARLPYRVVYGSGEDRLRSALAAIGELPPARRQERRWTWACDKCSDPDCEHRLFSRLRDPGSDAPGAAD